jgi:peptidylprolyl isomerase
LLIKNSKSRFSAQPISANLMNAIHMMSSHLFHASLVLGCALLAGKAHSAEIDDVPARDAVVARMGEVELHVAEVRKLVEAQSPEVRLQIESGTPALERLIRKELVRRAVLQEARHKEWDKRPEIIQKMDIARDQVVVSTYVNSLTRPLADYPSEDEIKTAYKGGKDTFKLPSQYHATQIYVEPSVESDQKAVETVQAKIEEPTEKTRNNTNESSAAATMSNEHGQNAVQHVEMVRRGADQERAGIRDAVPAMKTGEVSTAIRANPDWRIEMKPATIRELADVRESIVQTLRWRKAQENEAKYLEELASRSSVEINLDSLAQVLNKR